MSWFTRKKQKIEQNTKNIEKNYSSEVAKRWSYEGGEFGIISSISNPFCGDCSRIRLTAEGKLFTCLFSNNSHDVKKLIAGPSVFICDECVDLCNEIIRETEKQFGIIIQTN